MMDSKRRDAAVNGLALIGASVLSALSPFVTFVFLISMVILSNAFFKLSFFTGPVPNELWISLFFAVIAGFQAAVTLGAFASALPGPAKKKES